MGYPPQLNLICMLLTAGSSVRLPRSSHFFFRFPSPQALASANPCPMSGKAPGGVNQKAPHEPPSCSPCPVLRKKASAQADREKLGPGSSTAAPTAPSSKSPVNLPKTAQGLPRNFFRGISEQPQGAACPRSRHAHQKAMTANEPSCHSQPFPGPVRAESGSLFVAKQLTKSQLSCDVFRKPDGNTEGSKTCLAKILDIGPKLSSGNWHGLGCSWLVLLNDVSQSF